MRSYEIMIILDPEVDDRQVVHLVENHLKPAAKAGAQVTAIDLMGRRRFAYDIKKKSEGSYVVVTLEAEPEVVKEFDRRLTIDELVLRAKVFRPELRQAKNRRAEARVKEPRPGSSDQRPIKPATKPAAAKPKAANKRTSY